MSFIRLSWRFGLATLCAAGLPPALAPQGVTVTGRITIQDRDGRPGTDQAQAVVWLEGGKSARFRSVSVTWPEIPKSPDAR